MLELRTDRARIAPRTTSPPGRCYPWSRRLPLCDPLMSAHRAEYCAHASAPPHYSQGDDMADQAALAEIERRIRIVEDNLRELMQQAAAYSGAADEERNADRIADQQAKLDALLKEREALIGNG